MDIRHPSLPALFREYGVSAVIHLAARAAVTAYGPEAVEAEGVNVAGTLAVLEACRTGGVRRLVLASSAAVYGEPDRLPVGEETPLRPKSAYGASKVAAEAYACAYGAATSMQIIAFRPATVYGPGQRPRLEGAACSVFASALVHGQSGTIFGDGAQSRDFVYVRDVAEAFAAASLGGPPGTYNLGTGRETSIRELYSRLALAARMPDQPQFGPARPGDIRRSVLDPSAARRALGWEPRVTLEEGLGATVRWLRGSEARGETSVAAEKPPLLGRR